MEKTTTVQLSKSGGLVIPAAIRNSLHWQDGMELNIQIIASGLLVQPKSRKKRKRRLEDLRGILKHRGTPLPDEQLCAPVNYRENK
ncbi:MAG: AbrB/MazE/SpoVT family DNA-binding domain-containing protein [Candidatus Electrothrix scaldis]|nr:MAG: AbrB/MazE/SpoVT family DNA-binding domain-containing protein [Candidatus Electrothrix sp. GW3-3]